MEVLLATMTTPVQSLAQELERDGHIKRINDMTLEANTDLLDIRADHKDNIDATEINDFRISITNIERRTTAIYTGLCIWKTSQALEEAYGDPPTHINKATSEANGKTLDIETKYEEDIEALVDDAGPTIEEAYGDPTTHFNLRIRVIKATQPLSDKTIENNPNKAAA